jgi:flagellar hook protein FlgE
MALIGTLNSGVSAMKVFTKDLEVIGDNISNVNTTAFKSSKVAITDDFSNTLKASQPGIGASSNVQASQIGSGVKIASINVNYTQGALSTTGKTTDLGVSGEGYFLVKDASNSIFATRDGQCRWDDDGNLATSSGMKVMGAMTTGVTWSGGTPDVPTAAAFSTTAQAITKVTAGLPANVSLQSVSIDRSGNVVQLYSNGQSAVVGQVLLQSFDQPSSLMKHGDGLYTALGNAGPKNGILFTSQATLTPTTYQAGLSGNGTIESGTLELSNVDLTEQFSNMITAQRSFQAASRLVTVSDNVLEEIVNLKR